MPRRLLFGLLGCAICFVPARARAEDGFFQYDGVKIYYSVQGEGDPVVLIHGFSVNMHFQWMLPGIAGALARDYQVITFDSRGHGRSGKPEDPVKYGVEMVRDVVRLLDHLHIKRAHVVGYSMGGFIALKLATMHPERLLTTTLGAAGWFEKPELQLLDELADSIEQGKGISPLLLHLWAKDRPKPTPEQLKPINQMFALFNNRKAMAAVSRRLKDLTVTEQDLKHVRVPTLAIVGAQDPFKDGVDALKGRLPNLRVIVIPHADHMDAFAKPEFVKGVRAFLADHGQDQSTNQKVLP